MFKDPVTMLIPLIKTGGRRNPRFESIEEISTIDHDRESNPRDLGVTAANVKRIWEAVTAFYKTGLHPAVSIVIRRHGKILMSRGIGHAHTGAAGESMHDYHTLANADTAMCLFSASKAITAMLIHKLAEEGMLNLDDRVEQYLPNYATHGKANTTLLDLLTHRAGIHTLPAHAMRPETFFDNEKIINILCELKPTAEPGKHQAYHALTAGYVLGAAASIASGETLPDLLKRIIAEPLGCRHMTYGMTEENRHEAALASYLGPAKVPIANFLVKKLLGAEIDEITDVVNSTKAFSSIIPAGNIYATAEEACRFYQMLLDEGQWQGKQVFRKETIRKATERCKLRFDRATKAPMRYTPAFMAGEKFWSPFGFNTQKAFGHLGFVNILCWADPQREISVGFLNTGKSMAPEGLLGFANVSRTISKAIPTV